MENYCIIEITFPDTGEVKYIAPYNSITSYPKRAIHYSLNDNSAKERIATIPAYLNPQLIDTRQMIGTYISTYKGKFRFESIIDMVCKNNVTAILSFPILLPIALFIRFRKMYNQYVTNNR